MNRHQDALAQLAQLPVIGRVLAKLPSDLPHNLRYHGPEHTNDVLSEVVLFALHDNLTEHEIELLAIAAAYHDAGYMHRYASNEEIGAAMAAEAMQAAGKYSAADIEQVGQIILSTSLVDGMNRTNRAPLAGYLMDADWGAFGRDDFMEKCQQLIEETDADPESFRRQTFELVRNHSWQTPAAHALREAKKLENIQTLERELETPRKGVSANP